MLRLDRYSWFLRAIGFQLPEEDEQKAEGSKSETIREGFREVMRAWGTLRKLLYLK